MFCVERLVGESLHVICKRLFDPFTVVVFDTNNVQGILFQFLLNELVELAIVFYLAIHPFVFI